MTHRLNAAALLVLLVCLAGCGPSAETPRSTAPSRGTKEGLYTLGQQYWFAQEMDSASSLFNRAASMDSTYHEPVRDLAQLHYEMGMRAADKSRERKAQLGASRAQFERLASRGVKEAEIYDRLCELSVALGDDRSFLRWAKVNADAFPYDRQFFNLCRAHFDRGDFQSVIRTAKASIEKFSSSPYISSFYRILGRAYMKVDRDQTAERTLVAGLKATKTILAALRKEGGESHGTDVFKRLKDDTISMLLLLKQLHTTYKADDKLKQVERQLKEEGYDR